MFSQAQRLHAEEGVGWSEMAILLRNFKFGGVKPGEAFQQALVEADVPFKVVKGSSLLERVEVR
jgi:superfamily I DNA/RNA helicase